MHNMDNDQKDHSLSPSHLQALHQSAISDGMILARGYRTITHSRDLEGLGFAGYQCRVPGLLLPLHTTDGGNGQYVYRPDNPRVVEDKHKKNPGGTYPNKVIKYELPKGSGVRIDCPPTCQPLLTNPSIPLWITEGQKKADALASAGLCSIALLGVWNFLGKNENGSSTFLADWDYISLNKREVRIIFDSDVLNKSSVKDALKRLSDHLLRKGASVAALYLPPGENGQKVGVDDWLAAGHTVEDLHALVEAPRPAPKPAQGIYELLDDTPLTMSRPLALLDGQAYAATWLFTKKTIRETLDKQGEIIRHNPPITKTERTLFIVRDDGVIFGEGGTQPIDELGLEIHLAELPPHEKTMSTKAVKLYASGQHPDPADIFMKVVDIVSHFIDFDRSLGDQETMSEFIACYILSTWMLDAFNVVGFIWPYGDRGSGKTHLLIVITELAYLGSLILAGVPLQVYGIWLIMGQPWLLTTPKISRIQKRPIQINELFF